MKARNHPALYYEVFDAQTQRHTLVNAIEGRKKETLNIMKEIEKATEKVANARFGKSGA